MKTFTTIALMVGALLVGTTAAAGPGKLPSTKPEASVLGTKERADVVRQLVLRWGPELHAQGHDVKAWAVKLGRFAAKADATNLLNASQMPTRETMMSVLIGQAVDSPSVQASVKAAYTKTSGAKVLGSTVADTVYTPLPNGRCRVADSRVITSPIPASTDRSIDTEDIVSYASQGGNGSSAGDGSTNCGIPSFATALAVSVTVLPIADSGFFKIFANGTDRTRGNTVLYNAGTFGASSDVVVVSCQACAIELAIWSSTSVNYVIDVIGYFIPPQATALQCVETANTDLVIAAGGTGNAVAPACASGYTQTATNCESSTWQMPFVYFQSGTCSAQNNSAGSATLRASRTCCRVPGR